ncbi:MAG: DUF302 domain-containing protein [Granulosicoccaceae bacterium]|jgi:hypothetical protein
MISKEPVMRIPTFILAIVGSLLLYGCEPPQPETPDKPTVAESTPAATSHLAHFTVEGPYEFVLDDIKSAIIERGIKINNISHIGTMLARTAEDVGATKQVYAHAEAIEFCSSTISRAMMEADPHNIVFCPYIIAVYTLPEENGIVHIAYRRPTPVGSEASKRSLQAVEELLAGIVAQVVE